MRSQDLVILRARTASEKLSPAQSEFALLDFVAPFTGQFFKIAPIFRQMVFIGVRATPMVALTAFSVGVTLAMQAAHSLESLGAEMYIPDLVMLTLLARDGTGLDRGDCDRPQRLCCGSGNRHNESVRGNRGARSDGNQPGPISGRTAFPRHDGHVAGAHHFGDYIGILGGWAVCRFALDFNTAGYMLRALESADTWDLYSGMIKSVVFAWIIITIACNAGLTVEGGAEGVGQATTTAVVQALLAMLVMNAVLTGIFFFSA